VAQRTTPPFRADHIVSLIRHGLCPHCGFASLYRYDRMASTCRRRSWTCSLPWLGISGA